jgi:hypothetical protein
LGLDMLLVVLVAFFSSLQIRKQKSWYFNYEVHYAQLSIIFIAMETMAHAIAKCYVAIWWSLCADYRNDRIHLLCIGNWDSHSTWYVFRKNCFY